VKIKSWRLLCATYTPHVQREPSPLLLPAGPGKDYQGNLDNIVFDTSVQAQAEDISVFTEL